MPTTPSTPTADSRLCDDLALLEVLVQQIRAGERRELDVQLVQLCTPCTAAPRLVSQLEEPIHAGLERLVVLGYSFRQCRCVALQRRLNGSVLVLGVVDEELDRLTHLVGQRRRTAVVGGIEAAGLDDRGEQFVADPLVDVAVQIEGHRLQSLHGCGFDDGHGSVSFRDGLTMWLESLVAMSTTLRRLMPTLAPKKFLANC